MLTVLTWLWRQTPDRHGYFAGLGGADKVNVWAAMLRRNCGLELDVACVTDCPEGIDPSIRIIPLPTFNATQGISVRQWSEHAGAPQCYRRLSMFREDAAEIFGAERFVSMDLDVVIKSRVDPLFDHDCDFVMFKGTSRARPYNGSMLQMTAGARSAVWDAFAKDPQGIALTARKKYIGSDQAIISLVLGKGEETWGVSDGVEAYGGGFMRRYGRHPRRMQVPDEVKIVFFPGPTKPWQLLDSIGFVNEHWQIDGPRGRARADGIRGAASIMQRPAAKQPPFFAYDDRGKFGRAFKQVADSVTRRPTRLFIREARVPSGARAFIRATRSDKTGIPHSTMLANLHRRGVITLPTYSDSKLYFDHTERREKIGEFLSARSEPKAQFRICVAGGMMFGIRLKDASPMRFNGERQRKAGKLVARAVKAAGITWMSFDISIENLEPRISDVSLSWTVAPYKGAPAVDLSLKSINRLGSESFKVAVEILNGLSLNDEAKPSDQQASAG